MIQMRNDRPELPTHRTLKCWVCGYQYYDDEDTDSRRISYDDEGHTIKEVSIKGDEHNVCPECGNIFLDLYKRTPHYRRCYAAKEVQDGLDTNQIQRID